MKFTARDLYLAHKIKLYVRPQGFTALRIVLEARRAGIPVSLACAFLEQESGFRNVFGHDPVKNPIKGVAVDKFTYTRYLNYRRAGFGMQGVGPCQLTWFSYQDQADKLGGCWKPACNIQVGFGLIAALLRSNPTNRHAAIAKYNGTGPRARAYADSVLALQRKWHQRLA